MIVRAHQGETVDALVWRAIGRGVGAVEAVLAANRGLADFGPTLPEGTPVIITETASAPAEVELVQLWD